MKSKDFVLQHFPQASCSMEEIISANMKVFTVADNKVTLGIGYTESNAWVDARKFIQQHGTNPEKW